MGLFFSGHAPPKEREYLFIDGGCLRACIRQISKDIFGDANAFQPHVRSLSAGEYDKVFYYDAVPGKEHNEEQAAYEARVKPDYERFEQIQALDRFHIALGKTVGPNKRQKGVDVRLAVDMMTHAFRGKISKATLFAADADFVPLLQFLVSEGLHVTLWHPPQANTDLKNAADSTRAFDFRSNISCLTIDGLTPAFQMKSSGDSAAGPIGEGIGNIVAIGDMRFAGKFQNKILTLWNFERNRGWSYIQWTVQETDLSKILIAFDAAHSWGIAPTGKDWIET